MLRPARLLPISALIAVVGAFVAYAQPPGVPHSARLQTADNLKQMLGSAGMTAYGINPGHGDIVVYYAPNGTFRIRSGPWGDTGTYRITADGNWCSKYNQYNAGTEMCRAMYLDGHDLYFVWGGVLQAVIHKMVPGNPEHF
jgi:hypothetical protein